MCGGEGSDYDKEERLEFGTGEDCDERVTIYAEGRE